MRPLTLLIIVLSLTASVANAKGGTIVLMHIVPMDPANRTLSTEIRSFESGLCDRFD